MEHTPLDRRFLLGGLAGAVGASALAGIAKAGGGGPLNPPAGAVAPSAKPLSEVEPRTAINAANTPGDATSQFVISQPGSYYLTGNITGAAGRNGILITTANVTVDLRGFTVSGVAGSLVGILANLNTNVTVHSGAVIGWGASAVQVGSSARVFDITARGNGSTAIRCIDDSEVRNCSTVGGAAGIAVGTRGRVDGCTASGSAGTGIQTSDLGVVTASAAQGNQQTGISIGRGGIASCCTTGGNALVGINLGDGASAIGCTAMENSIGILANRGGTVRACTVKDNATNGISVDNGCVVADNTCERNGFGGNGAGIAITGAGNRVEGNSCRGADFGVYCAAPATGNVVVRNVCSGNTIDWLFGANNIYGPIVDRRAPASPPMSGFSSASTVGTADPMANISH